MCQVEQLIPRKLCTGYNGINRGRSELPLIEELQETPVLG